MPRTVGSKGAKTIQKELSVDTNDLNPPPKHMKGTEWQEKQAIKELEFLIRFLESDDITKNSPGQCLSFMGYRNAHLYDVFAKKFPDTCLPLWEFAKMVRQDKISSNTLLKRFDSRFGTFAMTNISSWRQTQQIDVATNVSIKARDYKGIQPIVNKRMADKKKGA